MLEKPAQLLKVVKDAIKVESDGYHFYQVAAEKTEDPKGKTIFSSLAQDELDHGSMLKGLYHAIKNKSGFKFDRKRHPGKKSRTRSKSPIFSAEFKRKIKEHHFPLSALRIGQLIEKSAIKFYSENAKKTKHPEMKALFKYLVGWETDHLKILIAQENFLKGKIEA